jgi:hypothetical protein
MSINEIKYLTDYEEYLMNLWCDPNLTLEELAQSELDDISINGTPEERHIVQYELRLLSND